MLLNLKPLILNGPEFREADTMQNGYIERFNRTFREDVLDAYMFEDPYQFREIKDEWMEDYNNHRPHEALNNHSPIKYCSA